MDFVKKAEEFFIQLQYASVIEPEPILQTSMGLHQIAIEPQRFFELVSKFGLVYPFIAQNEIIKLKAIMRKDGIHPTEAQSICVNLKQQYWALDGVMMPIMFAETKDKIKAAIVKSNSSWTSKDVNEATNDFGKYLTEKRASIYGQLIDELHSANENNSNLNQQKEGVQLPVEREHTERINASSRYYDSYQKLLRIIHVERLVVRVRGSMPYMYEDYKTEIKVEPFVTNALLEIDEFLEKNLYEQNEKRLLIGNMIIDATSFGSKTLEFLKPQSERAKGTSPEYSQELLKTATSIEQVREQLTIKLQDYLASLSIQPKVQKLITGLKPFGFVEYLKTNGVSLEKVLEMLDTNSGKSFVSYAIALLVEVGYYKHFRNQYCGAVDKSAHKKLGEVFGKDERTIRGNVNAMNPNSNDTSYKSPLFKQSIEKELRGT